MRERCRVALGIGERFKVRCLDQCAERMPALFSAVAHVRSRGGKESLAKRRQAAPLPRDGRSSLSCFGFFTVLRRGCAR